VVQQVQPAVVNVTTNLVQTNAFGGTQTGQGVGTGFVIRSDGIIVTNYHVVEGAQQITVVTPPPDSQRYQARVIGGDPTADLAVLKIEAQNLPTLQLGDSSKIQLGEQVVALGYALALKGGPTVTAGIVSALGRVISAQDPNCQTCANGARTYNNVIQTDAAINPGNSGGPLVDMSGQVIGINTAGESQAQSIGFAIAINAAKGIISHAVANPGAPVAYLGVVTQDVTQSLALQFSLPVSEGAYVVSVAPGGPAEKAGFKTGDTIVSFDGTTVTGAQQLGDLIHRLKPGEKASVGVVHQDGSKQTYAVTLGTNPLP
jgi:serine protease Do